MPVRTMAPTPANRFLPATSIHLSPPVSSEKTRLPFLMCTRATPITQMTDVLSLHPHIKVTSNPEISGYAPIQALAEELRVHSLNMIHKANSGHPGAALSNAEIIATTYAKHMRIDPTQPTHPERDIFVLSAGHSNSPYYAMLAMNKFFPVQDLELYRMVESHLQGHPASDKTKGVDASTGRLSLGFAMAAGMALAAKIDKINKFIYVLCGGGELQEGLAAETAEMAPVLELDNMILFVSDNRFQLAGPESHVSRVYQPANFLAKGWRVIEANGHNPVEIDFATQLAKAGLGTGMPTAILLRTIKGNGVDFMQDTHKWHGKAPSAEELRRALEQINPRRNEQLAMDLAEQLSSQRLPEPPKKEPLPLLQIKPEDFRTDEPTRTSSGKFLVEAMKQCPIIFPIDPDVGPSVMTAKAQETFGLLNTDSDGRCLDTGIREQFMAGLGAGLAYSGKIPYMLTFGSFGPITIDIIIQAFASMGLPGVFGKTHVGAQVEGDGRTHMDVLSALLAAQIPGLKVYMPEDSVSTVALLTHAFNTLISRLNQGHLYGHTPFCFALTRSTVPNITGVSLDPSLGLGYQIIREWEAPKGRKLKQIAVIAAGAMIKTAQDVADAINADPKVLARVTRLITAHALTEEGLAKIQEAIPAKTNLVVTLIDHKPQTLSTPVRLSLYEASRTPRVLALGPDFFKLRSGSMKPLYDYLGLSSEKIKEAACQTLTSIRKK